MKKRLNFLSCVVLAGLVLTACDKKTEELAWADLTIQQNKEKMQDDGLATMEKLNGMSDLTCVHAMNDLNTLLNSSSLSGDPMSVAMDRFMVPFNNMDKDVTGLKTLRAGNATIIGMTDILPAIGGVYTYDATTQSFVRVANTSEITFIYPIGTSTTNNGKLTFNNVSFVTFEVAGMNEDFFTSFDVKLTKNTQTLFSMELRNTYDANSTPTTSTTDIRFMEGYKFYQSISRSSADVDWSMAYTYNNENLLSSSFKTLGNFTNDALNNSASLENDEWIDQVLDNANATFQLGNLKVTGLVDIDKLKAAQNVAFPDGIDNTEADVNKECDMINQFVTLVVLYAKEGTVIAKSNFFTKEDTEASDYLGRTYFEPSLQFIFKDGSAMDQSFFDLGFEELEAAYEEMLLSFQTSYSE